MAYDHRLFYVLEGEGTIIISGHEYILCPQSIAFIPPKTGYYFKGKLKVAVFNFDMTQNCSDRTEPICPPSIDKFCNKLCFDLQKADGFVNPLVLSGDMVLNDTVLQVIDEFSFDDEYAASASSAKLKTVLIDILRHQKAGENFELQKMRKVLGYIKANAPDIKSNSELAKEFGYHPVYLGEVFKRVTGITLHDAICKERIQLACRWLTQTDRIVDDIAFLTGFCSRSHFCTVFKEKVGMTPSRYRKTSHSL